MQDINEEERVFFCPTCQRCHGSGLTQAQLDHVAEVAAERASSLMRDNFYRGVGSRIVSSFLYIVGLIAVSVFFWLTSIGFIKFK